MLLPYKAPQKGLSLLEVLFALVILAALARIASPGLTVLQQKHKLSLAVRDLNSRFQLFRMKAILEKSTYQIRLTGNQLDYRHKKEDTSWSDWNHVSLDLAIDYSMNKWINFSSKGFASPKTVYLKYGDFSQDMVVNINGGIRFSDIY